MNGHPERILPDETPAGIVEHHLAKYRFAAARSQATPVLDAACGVGYATAFLARLGLTPTIGVDIAADAMAVAACAYAPSGARYARADATRLPFADDSFGLVVGFETVEHIEDQDGYVAEVRRVLRPSGAFVCSTPYVPRTDPAPVNPFHVLELDADDFRALLQAHFSTVDLLTQVRSDSGRARLARRLDRGGLRRHLPPSALRLLGRVLGAHATPHLTQDDFQVVPGVDARGTELIAVCS